MIDGEREGGRDREMEGGKEQEMAGGGKKRELRERENDTCNS